jgi:AraC-like DNA-binding protein
MIRLGDGAEPETGKYAMSMWVAASGGQADALHRGTHRSGGRRSRPSAERAAASRPRPFRRTRRPNGSAASSAASSTSLSFQRPGADFAVREYGQLLILEVLRECMDGDTVPSGWLTLLGDKRLRPAVQNMHASPGASWSLDDLARASAMSRTAFAVRFREVAGMPPQAYLVRWRMVLAKRELRSEDTRLRELAHRLGYASESSFSSAFKRSVGEAPRSYRARMLSAG